jgi:hypothetical protein
MSGEWERFRRQQPGTAGGGSHGRGVSIYAIDERPSGLDPVLGGLFRTMRSLSPLSLDALAYELGTTPETLVALEAGQLRVFPSQAEARRVIEAYGWHVAIDVGPILRRLLPQISDEREPLTLAPQAVRRIADAHLAAEPDWRHAGIGGALTVAPTAAEGQARWAAAALRRPDAATVDLPVPATAAWVSAARRWALPAVLAMAVGAMAALPALLSTQSGDEVVVAINRAAAPARSGAVWKEAGPQPIRLSPPDRHGLRWVIVEDPRTRKADRLPFASPAR